MRWYEFTRPKMEIGIYFRIAAESIDQAWARMSWFVVDPQKWVLTLQKDEETFYLPYPDDLPSLEDMEGHSTKEAT